jgi:uncharacterized protein YndB with AHSA1/START domain
MVTYCAYSERPFRYPGFSGVRVTMSSSLTAAPATQVYPIFIKASPEAIWDAITKPEFSAKYFYGARIENTPAGHKSFGPDGAAWGDSPMFEFDPPRRMVHGWRSLYDPSTAAEPPSRVTWLIEPQAGDYSLLTVTHDQLENSPRTAEGVAGVGWMVVLSGLKTLLETGAPLAA